MSFDEERAGPSAPSAPAPYSRIVQHMRIEQPQQSIKGTYQISPYAANPQPPRFDMPRAEVLAASSASAAFEARNSAVNVTVVVRAAGEGEHEEPRWGSAHRRSRSKGGGEGARPGKPVFVNVKSYLSYVKLQMPQYQISAPLSIRAKSKGGDVHVHLPPTFSGMLSWVSDSGTLRLSPGVQARYTPVGESKKHRGVGRIVPPEGADQPLRGDSAELISTRGDLRVSIAGEDKTADRGCTIA